MAYWIVQNQGHAVGEDQEEGQVNRIGDEGIAIFLAGTGVLPVDPGNTGTVDLVSADWLGGILTQGGAKAGEIFQNAARSSPRL